VLPLPAFSAVGVLPRLGLFPTFEEASGEGTFEKLGYSPPSR